MPEYRIFFMREYFFFAHFIYYITCNHVCLQKFLSHKLILFSHHKMQAFPPNFLARKFSANWQFPQIFGRIALADAICFQRITTKLGGNACIVWVVCLIKYVWASKSPAGIFLLKVHIRNIRTRCEIIQS